MPTCSQITDALNTLASATTNPNVLADLSGQTASLTVPLDPAGTSLAPVELSAGGQALLTSPSSVTLSGRPFQITVCFNVVPTTAQPGNNIRLILSVGNPISGGNQIATQSWEDLNTTIAGNGLIVFTGVWDSITQNLIGYLNSVSLPNNNGEGSTFIPFSLASQSDLQFGLWADTEGPTTDPVNVLTVTQFKLQLI